MDTLTKFINARIKANKENFTADEWIESNKRYWNYCKKNIHARISRRKRIFERGGIEGCAKQ